ncbi:GNAT family N-acetyltransferase [Dongia sedimenti]|uniref:GNAT family N-acetyltransferase n=1 Tax=Dongia sedimenti TaxID=3064282 RepID=A0ABU0YG11_9PROT|nr:GNAT family N-acetyltransferase [Rhodospirillaceae bacterium R-7]
MSASFRIRLYAPTDLPAACSLLNALQEAECAMESNRAHWPDGAAAYTEWMLSEAAANKGAIFIAESNEGAPIGLASCWRVEDASDTTVIAAARVHLYVSDLVVVEQWRGRGVAGRLLAEAERHGRALGLAQMTIGVLSANDAARRAYAKAGFEDYEMLLRKRL